jgi:hypothetical protein
MRPRILLIAAVAALIAFAIGFLQRNASRRIEATAAQSEVERTQLETEIRQAKQRIDTAKLDRRRLESELTALQQKAAAMPAVRAAQQSSVRTPTNTLRDALLNDPQLQNLQLAAVEAKLTATYRPLFEQLQLSDARQAQFLTNLRKRGEQEMDLSAIIETQQVSANDPAITRMRQQMTDEFRAAQTAVLGEAGYRRLEDYERSIAAREFVNEVAGASAILGRGITAAQADLLAEAMAGASAGYREGRMATRNIGDIDWDQVLANAAGTLSKEQFGVFKNAVIQSRNMDRIRQLARQK